jgi:hypothetical protein
MSNLSTQKSPERRLIEVMILCLIGGLTLLIVPALIYLKGHQMLRASPSASSVSVEAYNSIADLAHYFMFVFMPMIGAFSLAIGYLVWRVYRLVVLTKKKDNAAA